MQMTGNMKRHVALGAGRFSRAVRSVAATDGLGFFLEKYPYPQRYAGVVAFRNRLTQYFWQGLSFDNPVMWREAELFDVGTINWCQTFQKPCSPEEGYP